MSRLATAENLEFRIVTIRGLSVLLDSDLALLYGVETKVLLQAMRRNRDRFPSDFAFQLTNQEVTVLRSQFGDGSRFSVDWMAIAGDFRPLPDHRGRPKQYGSGV